MKSHITGATTEAHETILSTGSNVLLACVKSHGAGAATLAHEAILSTGSNVLQACVEPCATKDPYLSRGRARAAPTSDTNMSRHFGSPTRGLTDPRLRLTILICARLLLDWSTFVDCPF